MKMPSLCLTALCAALFALALGPATATAGRVLLDEALLETSGPFTSGPPPPEGEIEGACGLALGPGGLLYVSDYYHRVVDIFSTAGSYQSRIALPGTNPAPGTNRLDAVCGLALDSDGRLYADELHQAVLQLLPSEAAIDGDQPTGVSVDEAGNLYVDDRDHIAKYAAPVAAGDSPVAEIGAGSLGDGYGLAVSPSGARVYVADASDQTVKVYEPASSAVQPAHTIAGFRSLRNGSLVVDPTNGHLLVADNVQPGFEHPRAAITEYDATGSFLGQLPGAPIDGEPTGLAVDPASGALYVTSGNDEEATVFAYGPFHDPLSASSPLAPTTSVLAEPSSPVTGAHPAPAHQLAESRGASASDILQRGGIRVKVDGDLDPVALPRRGTAGVRVSVGVEISATDGGTPQQLRRLSLAINRYGRFDHRGLPICRLGEIQPANNEGALEACRSSLVGHGRFSADVKLPEQSPFPATGRILAFNGRFEGRPAILAHVFGTKPVPASFTLPFVLGSARGTYGTVLRAEIPPSSGGSITGLRLDLGRSFWLKGRRHHYISAGCPAPAGFTTAVFPLARARFAFAGGSKLTPTLTRTCKVR